MEGREINGSDFDVVLVMVWLEMCGDRGGCGRGSVVVEKTGRERDKKCD